MCFILEIDTLETLLQIVPSTLTTNMFIIDSVLVIFYSSWSNAKKTFNIIDRLAQTVEH